MKSFFCDFRVDDFTLLSVLSTIFASSHAKLERTVLDLGHYILSDLAKHLSRNYICFHSLCVIPDVLRKLLDCVGLLELKQ